MVGDQINQQSFLRDKLYNDLASGFNFCN